ncbi:AIR carboxylase family protein [Candidatus Peregrinibacteria bacterium]|nr:AIR carboxylase family protein [Candidatus Peregrinibacteria bacterium]
MMVPILLGSEKDKEFARKITKHLDAMEIPFDLQVASAHKVPELVLKIIQKYNQSTDAVCYITIAGRSNGLSGVVAANSIHPCLACPPFNDKEDLLLNLNSSVIMPSDTPVLTVIDPQNAAMAAARILALADKKLREKIKKHIQIIKSSFIKK